MLIHCWKPPGVFDRRPRPYPGLRRETGWAGGWKSVTPTFCKNKNFCANRSAYKNAYQIIVLVKNFPKINLA
jgi:hypothetical protein